MSGPDWKALHSIPTLIPPPSDAVLTKLARERLGVIDPKTNLSNAITIVDGWIEKAKTDTEALKLLLDRTEGRVKQDVDVKHSTDSPVVSAALSALAALYAEAERYRANRLGADHVPDGPVLLAPVRSQEGEN